MREGGRGGGRGGGREQEVREGRKEKREEGVVIVQAVVVQTQLSHMLGGVWTH